MSGSFAFLTLHKAPFSYTLYISIVDSFKFYKAYGIIHINSSNYL